MSETSVFKMINIEPQYLNGNKPNLIFIHISFNVANTMTIFNREEKKVS